MMGAQLEFIGSCALKLQFNFIGCFPWGETRPVRDPKYVCINGDCRLSEGFIEHNICCFSTNAGQAHQVLARPGNLPIKRVDQHLGQCDDVLRFVAPETNCADVVFNAFEAEANHLLWRIGDGEQALCRFVHAHICCLGRQSNRDYKRVGI